MFVTKRAARLLLLASLAGAAQVGCSKKDDGQQTTNTTQAAFAHDAIVEVLANASIAWTVGTDGKVRADVTSKDGVSLSKNANGTLEYATESGEPATAKLTYDDGAKALVTTIPVPKRDITEIKYKIDAEPGALSGVLHVPVGGTTALAADAKAAESVPVSTTTGPNGGTVQVVGDDRVEIVADDDSDEVRVYVVDASGKPVTVGDRKITLAVNADSSDVVVLTPSSDGLYLVGNWKVKTDPTRVTVVVRRANVTRVAIVGWKPGAKLLVVDAPKIKVKSKNGWGKGGKVANGVVPGNAAPGSPVVKVDLKVNDDKNDDKGKGKGKDDDRGKGGGKGGKGK